MTATLNNNTIDLVEVSRLNKIFADQTGTFNEHMYPSAEERIYCLKQLRDAVLDNLDELTQAVCDDFGNRSVDETKLLEIIPFLEAVKYAIKNIRKWMRPSKRKVPVNLAPGKAWVEYQPLGIIGVISPWNYPLALALVPTVNAIAAGNRVMIKMSEFTPNAADVLQRVVKQAFAENLVAIISGGVEVAQEFSKQPFNHLIFTGSTNVGRHVMHAAADNLTPVTLELGGKSPAILHKSYPIQHAVDRMAWGKCINVGQTCVSPDYLFCPTPKVGAFISLFKKKISEVYPTMLTNKDYTSVINERQKRRLTDYLVDAKEKGADIIEINPANEDFSNTNKMPLHIVTKVTDEMDIMNNEIFGPILIVKAYDDIKEAISYINNKPRPLALYYFDYDQTRCDRISRSTHSGGVCFNETMNHVGIDDMPFGGVGDSGMGHYHGAEGFQTFSKAKGIFKRGKINPTVKILPPFGGWFHEFIYKQNIR